MRFSILLTSLMVPIFSFNVALCNLYEDDDDEDAVGTRIFAGLETDAGEYPFIARIHGYRNNSKIFCTGSIIHENWILTAGHCLRNSPGQVTVGTKSASGFGGQNYGIKKTYIPDNYVVRAYGHPSTGELVHYYSDNDIGLIELKEPIDFSPRYVERISIDATNSADYETKAVLYVGFGKTEKETNSPALLLQMAEAHVVNTTSCQEAEPKWVIRNSLHICVSADFDSTICSGDAGAPLILDGIDMQIGVANHGKCGGKGPSLFQRVSVHYPWIKETIEKQSYKLSD